MRQCEVSVALDSVVVNFQRNKSDPDRDFAVLVVSSTHALGQPVTVGPVSLGTPSSGATIGPPLVPAVESGGVLLGDDDQLVIWCHIENRSHSDSAKTAGDLLQVAGLIAAGLGGGVELGEKLKLFKLSGTADALLLLDVTVGAILTGVGTVIADLGETLGIVEPDCDGPVFDSRGAGLPNLDGSLVIDQFVNAGSHLAQPFRLEPALTDDTIQVDDKCGHPPSTTVQFTATVTSFAPEVPVFGGGPGPARTYRSIVGRRPDVWIGMWGEGSTFEGSRVRCTIAWPDDLGVAQAATADASGGVIAISMLQVTIEEHLDGPDGLVISSDSVRSLVGPGVAKEYHGDQPPIDITAIVPHTTHTDETAPENIRIVASQPLATSAPIIGIKLQAAIVHFADSVTLSDGATLQLFMGIDDNQQVTGTFLRYTSTHSSDTRFTTSDFMLHPVEHTPR